MPNRAPATIPTEPCRRPSDANDNLAWNIEIVATAKVSWHTCCARYPTAPKSVILGQGHHHPGLRAAPPVCAVGSLVVDRLEDTLAPPTHVIPCPHGSAHHGTHLEGRFAFGGRNCRDCRRTRKWGVSGRRHACHTERDRDRIGRLTGFDLAERTRRASARLDRR